MDKDHFRKVMSRTILAVFLLLCIFGVVLPVEFNSASSVVAILEGVLSVIGVFFSALQAIPEWRDELAQFLTRWSFPSFSGKQLAFLLAILIILSLGLNVVQAGIILGRNGHDSRPVSHAAPPSSPTQAEATPFPTVTATPDSSLIPPNTEPILNDPLNNASSPYQWDTGLQGGATCSFVQGGSYVIAAPANAGGGECNTEARDTNFTNFVYQIKMQINEGLQGEGGTGPSFCVGSPLGGSLYALSFDSQGHWTFSILTGGISGNVVVKTILAGVNHFFITGIGQANYLTLRVKNHQIDAQVDGYPIFSTVDVRLSTGQIGVQLGSGTHDAAVAFSEVRVWALS